MKKITFIALFFCTSLVFAETDPQVKASDVCEANSVKEDNVADERSLSGVEGTGDATENTENAETPEALTFTDEPLEEEVVEDEAFLELLKTALIPELHPLDEANGAVPAHISLSFVSATIAPGSPRPRCRPPTAVCWPGRCGSAATR